MIPMPHHHRDIHLHKDMHHLHRDMRHHRKAIHLNNRATPLSNKLIHLQDTLPSHKLNSNQALMSLL